MGILAKSVYWITRIGQIGLLGIGILMIVGSISQGQNIILFIGTALISLLSFVGIGILELLLIRPIERRQEKKSNVFN